MPTEEVFVQSPISEAVLCPEGWKFITFPTHPFQYSFPHRVESSFQFLHLHMTIHDSILHAHFRTVCIARSSLGLWSPTATCRPRYTELYVISNNHQELQGAKHEPGMNRQHRGITRSCFATVVFLTQLWFSSTSYCKCLIPNWQRLDVRPPVRSQSRCWLQWKKQQCVCKMLCDTERCRIKAAPKNKCWAWKE